MGVSGVRPGYLYDLYLYVHVCVVCTTYVAWSTDRRRRAPSPRAMLGVQKLLSCVSCPQIAAECDENVKTVPHSDVRMGREHKRHSPGGCCR